MKFASWAFVVYQFFVLLLVLNGAITFGNGLGDLGMVLIYAVIILGLIFLNIWASRRQRLHGKKSLLILAIGFGLIAALVMTLYFTIWRGPEYPWNGNIFISKSI